MFSTTQQAFRPLSKFRARIQKATALLPCGNISARFSEKTSDFPSQTGKNKLPTHIEIASDANGLKSDSVVLAEQIRTIDKSRLKEKIGHIDDTNIMSRVNNAIGISFGLEE